jgi:hypothetical protein
MSHAVGWLVAPMADESGWRWVAWGPNGSETGIALFQELAQKYAVAALRRLTLRDNARYEP